MSHLTLEYTPNVQNFAPEVALQRLNAALLASGQFEGPDIKSRAVALDCFRVGDGSNPAAAFVHVSLSLLTGRTPAIKSSLSEALHGALVQMWAPSERPDGLQVTVEVLDLDRAFYRK